MKTAVSGAFVFGLALTIPGTASAQSCFDLWYARNAIFDRNGYCFSTDLGQRTFDNSDCWTTHPQLSPSERQQVARIQAEERRRGCDVN